mmetsp:Transcript_9336/g.38287  ORF Transcript_9336/g.38287 Transcript_9336/m.38287 type:complete len:369 (-) Transcript_9336:139-1245(-)
MVLWVDAHRPTSLAKMDYHKELSKRLGALAADGDIPHLLFYGPSGAGKKTRIAALLKALFGPGADKHRLEHREFKTPTNRTVEITTCASNYHIEMNPGDAGSADRFVVQEVIKEMAQSGSVHGSSSSSSRGGGGSSASRGPLGYKVVVLVEVDRLSRQAQAALRRTMEKCTATCRLVLCCTNPSKVIDPVRSRCLGIRVAAPTEREVCAVLQKVADKERFSLPDEFAARVAKASRRNVRRALLALEACKAQRYPFGVDDQPVDVPDWELYVKAIAKGITDDQSPQRLLQTRDKLFELLAKCVPADLILKTLVAELLKLLDDDLKPELIHWAAVYEHRIQLGSKEIFHLEAFVARFMAIYKRFLVDMFS